MSARLVPIITYHGVDEGPAPLFISPAVFESHLAALADSGRTTVSLAGLLENLRQGKPLPENAVVLTFDDGYESVCQQAWPRLQSFGFGATVFLITDYCGRDNRWPGQPPEVPTRPLLSWQQVEALGAQGCEFGAHTRSHAALTRLAASEAEDEIVSSQQHIRDRIGQPALTFAYPYGAVSPGVRDIVGRHFLGATGARLGLVRSGNDLYDLKRIDAFYLTKDLMHALAHPALGLYLNFRQALRTARRLITRDWQQSLVNR